MRGKGYSLQGIGEVLHRPKSVVWYELTKSRKNKKYDPDYAHHVSYVRRKYSKAIGKKIAGESGLRNFVESHLFDDQSPEAVSGRLKYVENDKIYSSASAIRRYVKSPYGRRIEAHLQKIFKKRRRRRGTKRKLEGKRMITKRPWYIAKRRGLGHTEGDFIVSGKSGKGMLLVLIDRKTRKRLLEKISPVSVRTVEGALKRMKKRYPEMQTLTFDNDLLLLEHKKLEKKLNVKIYFCHPHSPWEKPSVERLNKDIRRYIPKGSNISKYSRAFIKKLEEKLNRRFLEVLGFYTPNEMYEKEKKKCADKMKKTP